jgi:hypothetical protein
MAAKGERKGGVHIDPAVAQWQATAATNLAALTAKQRKDRARVRVKYDLDPALKAAVDAGAKAEGTSASQLAAFLLSWAMREYHAGNAELRSALEDGKSDARTPRVASNLDAPSRWLQPTE